MSPKFVLCVCVCQCSEQLNSPMHSKQFKSFIFQQNFSSKQGILFLAHAIKLEMHFWWTVSLSSIDQSFLILHHRNECPSNKMNFVVFIIIVANPWRLAIKQSTSLVSLPMPFLPRCCSINALTSLETARSLANSPSWEGRGAEGEVCILPSPGVAASPISLLSMGGVCGRSLTAGKILFTGRQTCSLYLVLWFCAFLPSC